MCSEQSWGLVFIVGRWKREKGRKQMRDAPRGLAGMHGLTDSLGRTVGRVWVWVSGTLGVIKCRSVTGS